MTADAEALEKIEVRDPDAVKPADAESIAHSPARLTTAPTKRFRRTWKPAPGTPFELSQLGEARNAKTKRVLLPSSDKDGYCSLVWRDSTGRKVFRYLHQLVAAAHLGPLPPGHQVAHDDGCRTHCAVWNLRYVTTAGNGEDRRRHNALRRYDAELRSGGGISARERVATREHAKRGGARRRTQPRSTIVTPRADKDLPDADFAGAEE